MKNPIHNVKTLLFIIIFLLSFYTNISFSIEDTTSIEGWSPINTGMNGPVHALTIFNGNIVAGGEFTNAGGQSVNNIALWNGTAWQPLGLGVNGGVLALAVFNNELIAGGEFTTAGGIVAYKIAKWDGINWTSLNSGFNGDNDKVMSLIEHGNDLIVGGQFSDTVVYDNSRVQLNNVAKWTGTVWQALGSGLNNLVTSFTIYNAELVAGGKFDGKVKIWDGNVWTTVGSGLNNTVNALEIYNNLLIAGGEFNGYISQWNGTNWNTVGGGVEDDVWALFNYRNSIIVGGDFKYVGMDSMFVNRIASWDGNSWSEMMTGMNDRVEALIDLDSTKLIVGGEFTTAGGFIANRIADWRLLETFSVSGEVRYANNQPVTSGQVRAVRIDYYTYEIIVVDSAIIQSDGSYVINHITPRPHYIITYPEDEELDYIPTYYPATIFWENAIPVNPDSNLINVNITVEPIVGEFNNLVGPGSIGGHVYLNYLPPGYITGNGMSFKSGAIVYAKIGNSYKGFGVSNRFVKYRIDSLPEGNYDVIVNRLGYTTAFANVTLNIANGYTIDSLDFILDTVSLPIGIQNINTNVPPNYILRQNYPNPFNPETNIEFSIPVNTEVSLRVFNILGQEVMKLLNNVHLNRGSYNVQLRTGNLPSGVYFYRLETYEFVKTKKMLLIK